MFLFYTNRVGCGWSLAITLLGSTITMALMWLAGWIRF